MSEQTIRLLDGMNATDVLKYREMKLAKLGEVKDPKERAQLEVIVNASEQLLDLAFGATINQIASNPKALPGVFTPEFDKKVLAMASGESTEIDLTKEEPKEQTKLEFDQKSTPKKSDLAVVIGEGWEESIAKLLDGELTFLKVIKTVIETAAENCDKDYASGWSYLRHTYPSIKLLIGYERQFAGLAKHTSPVQSFLRLRTDLGLTENQASVLLEAMIRKVYDEDQTNELLNPSKDQINEWYKSSAIHSLIRILYDNVMIDGKYNEKAAIQIIHHCLDTISPERRKKLAERVARRAASYKEKGYSD
jgi:hypothetical protein